MSVSLLEKYDRKTKVLAKRIHRLNYALAAQIKNVCEQGRILSNNLGDAIHKVDRACEICARSGGSIVSRNISITHVNEPFNLELLVDFEFKKLTDPNRHFIVKSPNPANILHCLEMCRILQHDAPPSISADDGFHDKKLFRKLDAHNIIFKAIPTRGHNKTGIVDRKIKNLKGIIWK